MSEVAGSFALQGAAAQNWLEQRPVTEYLALNAEQRRKVLLLVAPLDIELRSQSDAPQPDLAFSGGALVTDRAILILQVGGVFKVRYGDLGEILFDEDLQRSPVEELGRSRQRFDISWYAHWTDIYGESGASTHRCTVSGAHEDVEALCRVVDRQVALAARRKQRKAKARQEAIIARARADEPITPEEFAELNGEYSAEYWDVILPRRSQQGREDGIIVKRAREGLGLSEERSARLKRIDPGLHTSWLERVGELAHEVGVRPAPTAIRTPRDAEENAAKWMRYWGFDDAEVTRAGADEGIDVDSSGAIAQVKAYMVPVGRPDLQNLAGVAAVEQKRALFFALSGFTEQAREWAERAGMALFTFDLLGDPEPMNAAALDLTHLHR
jgi:hypothetical protein